MDDPASMKRVYDRLGKKHMYVIAETNIPLSLRKSGKLPGRGIGDILIYGPHGIGLWRDDDGTVYMDDVHVWVNLLHSLARKLARKLEQRSILYVNGRTRTHKFVEV